MAIRRGDFHLGSVASLGERSEVPPRPIVSCLRFLTKKPNSTSRPVEVFDRHQGILHLLQFFIGDHRLQPIVKTD